MELLRRARSWDSSGRRSVRTSRTKEVGEGLFGEGSRRREVGEVRIKTRERGDRGGREEW